MGKRKRMETQLPEAMIHQIQSFLTAKEAAQTTLISKSWYNAWLTRPALAFDQRDFKNLHRRSSAAEFLKFAVKTMQRYQDLKIDSLSFQSQSSSMSILRHAHKLILDALKMGATQLNLEFRSSSLVLPPEVLQSETLLRLSLSGCEIDGNINCKMLKSLSLNNVLLRSDDMLRNILSCCNSIEELSLSNSSNSKPRRLALSGKNLPELRKLKRLYLEMVDVDNSFFFDFGTRFPCLKDLSLIRCHIYKGILIASSSLQRITIVQLKVLKAEFEVANLAVFSFSGAGMPSLTVEARDGWESHIYLERHPSQTSSWYKGLQALLTQLSSSRINLTISTLGLYWKKSFANLDDVRVVGQPVAVENLRLEAEYDAGYDMVALFCICRPKFLTHYWRHLDGWRIENHSLENLCEKLIGEKNMFGRFDLKEANKDVYVEKDMYGRFDIKEGNMEVYVDDVAEWRPLRLQDALRDPPKGRKVRFHLKW